MKMCSIIFILVNLILITAAFPSRIFYYTGARSEPYKNGMMYFQYAQPGYRNIAAGEVRAYSSGDTLATGTYVNPADCNDEKHVETFAARVNVNEEKDATTSIAEAYPPLVQENVPVISGKIDDLEEQGVLVDNNQSQDHKLDANEEDVESDSVQYEQQPETVIINRKDRTGGFDHQVDLEHVDDSGAFVPTTTVAYAENEITIKNDVTTSLPPTFAVPIAPVKPEILKPNRPNLLPAIPKKKIQVRLDAAAVEEEQDEEFYNHYNRVVPKPVYLPNRGAPQPPAIIPSTQGGTGYASSQSSNKKKNDPSSQTGQSFFPVYFGGDNGGSAIAIANSYSTGEGGSATSHAIAYGSPAASQLRHKKVHRNYPVKRQ